MTTEVKKRERHEQFFWGFFLLTLGFLYMLDKYAGLHLYATFDSLFELWPLILIFWGISVLVKGTFFRPIISILFGIFVALLLYGWISPSFVEDEDFENDEFSIERYESEYNDSISTATLKINSGVGKLRIEHTTLALSRLIAKSDGVSYSFKTFYHDSSASVRIKMLESSFDIFDGDFNNIEVKLNENPVWNIRLNLGATSSKLYLDKFKIKSFDMNAGASKSYIKFGSLYDSVYVSIDAGASSLKIAIPENAGCRVAGETALFSKSLEGFNKKNGIYETPNLDSASVKFFISIDGGVSKLKIVRY
ncbi:MAG: hypothetical protein GXO87_01560 [Chlorobi bacterium]|nr:hypothetical protein [Chlorobiota bacterium]